MKRKIFRAMILTILLVFSIVIVMEIAQGVFVRRNQEQYIEELEESSGIISREYTRLTDESLSNLAAKKAAEAEIVFRESGKMLTTLRNQLLFVLTEDDKTIENNFSLPQKDAGEGEISSYYGLPDDVDAKDEKVKSDIAVLSRIAPTIEASIEPGSAIYGAGVLTMSGPVMLTNTNEAMAASEMPYLNEWSGVIRESLPSAADKINYYVQVPDIVTSENCCMVVLPVFYNEEAWGALFYLIQESYFTNLVEENYLDEQDICFITPRKRINAIITTCEKTPSDEIGCGMNRTSFSFCISPS